MDPHTRRMCAIPEHLVTEEDQDDTANNEFQGKKFNGNPRNYSWFIQSFEKYVSENNIDAATGLDLLTESCVGRARERIETFRYVNPAPRGLKIALQTLKLHYGKNKDSVKMNNALRAR